ncbi:restriction endonuclease [Vandammella animalimorsus]|uniref:Restriction endonuclease n=1 Tax=Vandammella animalimorsus TaxID=2029117 RepID=A0A2A2AGB3_9BURK|nr:restriction endonuclease [Vandammella animalimorsus]PAT36804.1 restriction endonuclease [Vandammella animalimorsus]
MKRPQSKASSLFELGLRLAIVGSVLLLVPTLLGSHPAVAGLKAALYWPGVMALGLGLLLLGFHQWRKQQGAAFRAAAVLTAVERSAAAVVAEQAKGDVGLQSARQADQPEGESVTPNIQARPSMPAHERLSGWSPEVFAAIEWRRFEAVVQALFAQAGFEARSQSHGADGGVDIWLHSRHAGGALVSVVQCKHWQGRPVPVSAMREFFGVMASHGLKRGTYATSSRFTADALAFARAHGINAQDGAGLLKLIASRSPEQQAALLAVAFEGEYWRPTCASCGVKMAERAHGKTGQRFWGCVNYPRCRNTLAMR